MDEGFIKLHRKMLNWEWYDDNNTKILFIHCLFKANYRDLEWHGIEIKRGTFISSYANLAKETKLSVQSVRTSVNKLKSTGELTTKASNKYTLFIVNNYCMYQDINNQNNNQVTNNQQTTNKQLTTSKERKERKEYKEYIYKQNFSTKNSKKAELPEWFDDQDSVHTQTENVSDEEIQKMMSKLNEEE